VKLAALRKLFMKTPAQREYTRVQEENRKAIAEQRKMAPYTVYKLAPCEGQCQRTCKTLLRPAMTSYTWDGKDENPNRPLRLCDDCYDEYHAYWQERWDEYNAGLL
jgi:hypothetical protein